MPNPTFWYVVASARGLQDYILRSPRLVDMVGASELIERLAGELGGEVLRALNADGSPSTGSIVGKSAGTLRLVFERESEARNFVNLWPFLCDRVAPGLEAVSSMGPLDATRPESIRSIEGQIETNRNRRRIRLPLGSLATAWNPRTGSPADGQWLDTPDPDDGALDHETGAKRTAANDGQDRLLTRCLPPDWVPLADRFAKDLTEFGTEDSAYIGLIHIDTNGLGQRFQKLARRLGKAGHDTDWMEEWKRVFVRTSEALASATQEAVQQSLVPLLQRLTAERLRAFPIRPLVCAGDDLTLIVRADLAMEFTQSYLTLLPQLFQSQAADLPEEFTTEPLTAAAGVVFVPCKFPFYDAYAVCEHLVQHTKNATQRKSSGVSFARLTEPNLDAEIFPVTDLGADNAPLHQTLCPYTLEGDRPALDALFALAGILTRIISPGLREFPRAQQSSLAELDAAFARICEVLDDHHADGSWELRLALSDITGRDPADTRCYLRSLDGVLGSPIRDALELVHLGVPATPPPSTSCAAPHP